MSARDAVYAALDAMGIAYDAIAHEPAFTMEECDRARIGLNAVSVKNMFLCPRSGKRYYLLIARPDSKLKTKDISRQAGSARLSFAPEDRLMEYLHERPGAISPMGLIFDEEKRVTLLADEALKRADRLAFHPCVNTESLAMSSEDFFGVFLPKLGCEPVFVTIHDFMEDQQNEEETH